MKDVRTKVVTLLAGVQLLQSSTAVTASDCSDLKRVAARALTGEKFASIAGKARDVNFFDTTLCCSLNTALNFACVLCDHGSCRLQVGATAPFMGHGPTPAIRGGSTSAHSAEQAQRKPCAKSQLASATPRPRRITDRQPITLCCTADQRRLSTDQTEEKDTLCG